MHIRQKLLDYVIFESEGIITFKNQNTTLGFVRYSESGVIEYIFVQPMYRNNGLGKKLLYMVEERTKNLLTLAEPISTLGNGLFESYKKIVTP
jgi:GNAT superfamily N-acetyltransferase